MKATLRKYFVTGLLILVPILISWIVLLRLVRWLYNVLDFNILPDSISVRKLTFLPDIVGWLLDVCLVVADFGLALLTVVVVILFTGMMARAWVMRKLLHLGESIINRLPLIGIVYRASKQLMETLFREDAASFQRVVMVEFPREGVWSLAFVSNRTAPMFEDKVQGKMINVFLPTSPNPTTGFLMMYPREKVLDLDLSVEDAFKMIMSAGVIQPGAAHFLETAVPRDDSEQKDRK